MAVIGKQLPTEIAGEDRGNVSVDSREHGPLIDRTMALPPARGPLSEHVITALASPLRTLTEHPPVDVVDAAIDDDLHLALYLCYELHYTTVVGVDPRWEWEPSLLFFRRELEEAFEKDLCARVPISGRWPGIPDELRSLAAGDDGISLSRYLEREPTRERFEEFVIHRSAYQLKEADPHSWVLPRLGGAAKAALVEIQTDEYGGGEAQAMHAVLFKRVMEALKLDARYGAYIHRLPGVTLAGVNLMSMFGLHRRWRGAIVGHLALFEMSSTEPNRRYGKAMRALGFEPPATVFFDEHVEADAVHEAIAAYDLAGALAREEPDVAGDISFGARSLLYLESLWAAYVTEAWSSGRSSLL